MKRKHADLEELFDLIKTLSEEEAFSLFTKIRAGMEPQEVMEQARYGSTMVKLSRSPSNKRASRASPESGDTSSQDGKEVRSGSLQVILRGGKVGDQQ